MQIAIVSIAFLVLAFGLRPVRWNGAYLSKETTSTINGLFITLVFLSHFSQYSTYMSNYVARWLGQLIVVMFLFYSGYGCMVQYKAKGRSYLQTFPKKRVLSTLVNFDIAVAIFVVVGLLLGKSFSIKQVALSFVCWDSVGNSNWYIFAILLCYLAFWLVFDKLPSKVRKFNGGGLILQIILIALVIGLSRVKEPWWYDTIMSFGAGVMYAIYKEEIEAFVRRWYWAVLIGLIAAFMVIPYLPLISRYHFAMFNMKSVAFALIVVLLTMKFEIRCPVFAWCGRNLFPLYIYQRIPMIVFFSIWPAAFADWRSWIFFCLSAIITVGIALAYQRAHKR